MTSRVSEAEAARSLFELLNRIRYRADEFIVERGGEPICRMVPSRPHFTLGDLVRLLDTIVDSRLPVPLGR